MSTNRPPLSDLQVFALSAVRDDAVKFVRTRIRGREFIRCLAEDKDITCQIKALRQRRLISYDYLDVQRTMRILIANRAGIATLHYVEGLTHAGRIRHEVISGKTTPRDGKGNLRTPKGPRQ